MVSHEPRSPGWSNKSAFETDLALEEAQKWIEDVTGQKFRSSRFKTSLQDGVLLCKLVNSIKPGIVKKIHQTPGTMFYVENVTFFLEGCKIVGLKGSQLFDVSDLQDVPRAREARGGALRGDHERRLRNVCITIYWLGRAAKGIADYKGPHLDESKFRELIAAHPVSGESEKPVKGFRQPGDKAGDENESKQEEPEKVFPTVANGNGPVREADLPVEMELGATEESVSEQVELRKKNKQSDARPLTEAKLSSVPVRDRRWTMATTFDDSVQLRDKRHAGEGGRPGTEVFRDFAISIDTPPDDDRFGFSVVGGKDEGFQCRVDEVHPGSPADAAGLKAGDLVLWVNGQTVLNANHSQVVSLIQACIPQKGITVGVRRSVPRRASVDIHSQRVSVGTELQFIPSDAPTVKAAEVGLESQTPLPDFPSTGSQKSSDSDRDSTPMSPIMSPPPMSPSPKDEKKRKARYKTARALEVHYQTKKRTRTEVITQEEQEEVPGSLQSGHSRRLVYITRASLVRRFETITRPKREIAWLSVYAGALFHPQHVKSSLAAQKAKPIIETTPTVTALPSEVEEEIIIDTEPVVVHETVKRSVDISENPLLVAELEAQEAAVAVVPTESLEAQEATVAVVPTESLEAQEATVAVVPTESLEATPTAIELPNDMVGVDTTIGAPALGVDDENLRKRPRESSGSPDDDQNDTMKKERTTTDSDEDQVVPVMMPSPLQTRLVPSEPAILKPLVAVQSGQEWTRSGDIEPHQESSITVMEVESGNVDWSQGNENFEGLKGPPNVSGTEEPDPSMVPVPVEEDIAFEVKGLVMAAGPSMIDIDVAKPQSIEKAEIQLQPVVETTAMEWDDMFTQLGSAEIQVPSSEQPVVSVPKKTNSSPARSQRYSLTEEVKAESKKQMDEIWAIAEGKDDEERNRRSRSPTRSVAETELEVIQKIPLVRSAARLTSWEEECDERGARLTTAEGVEHLLATLSHIKSKYGSEATGEDGFSFLEGLITGPEFKSAMEVHRKLKAMGNDAPQPVGTDLAPYSRMTNETLDGKEDDDMNELKEILQNPHFQGVCFAHDKVAHHDFTPTTPDVHVKAIAPLVKATSPLLSPIVDNEQPLKSEDVPLEPVPLEPVQVVSEASPVKDPQNVVRINREGSNPVGVTVAVDEADGSVYVARVLVGGPAKEQGGMKEGDEILAINGKPVQGKTVDQVAAIMRATPGPVDFEIKAAEDTEMPILSVETFIKAQFNYNPDPEHDRYLPCVELGLSFNVGDILHVLNQNDPNWWQAVKENEKRSMAGLIPSKQFRESLDAMKPKPTDGNADQKSKKRKKTKKKHKHVYQFEEPGDFDVDEILSYEEVVKANPDPNYKRPIVLIGPVGVGRRTIINKLLKDHSNKFAAPTPDTSRPKKGGESDGSEYNFVDENIIKNGVRQNRYVEAGVEKGVWYGTRIDVIRAIGQSGKVAVFPLFPKSLRIVKASDLKPYVVYLKPRNIESLSPKADRNGRASNNSSKGGAKETDLLEDAQRIEDHYAHYFDCTLEVSDVQQAAQELVQVADRLQSEPQWIYANWVR